jgi:hypothetical protein
MVMALGSLITLKKFYEIDTCSQFTKLFWHSLCRYQHIALSFDHGYAARVMNYIEKKIYEIGTCSQFTKPFWHSLRCYQHIALSFDYGYVARVMNYIEKRFMILTPAANS